jgi:hypothetical protein
MTYLLEQFHRLASRSDTNCATAAMRLFKHDIRYKRALNMIEYLGIDYPDADALISRQYHNTISLYLDECDPKLIGPTFAAWKAGENHLAYAVGIDGKYYAQARGPAGKIARVPNRLVVADYEVAPCRLF